LVSSIRARPIERNLTNAQFPILNCHPRGGSRAGSSFDGPRPMMRAQKTNQTFFALSERATFSDIALP
jgi:hypothetical protein